MNEKAPNPLRAKARMPFSPTIRPTLGLGTSSVSVFLYAIVAVALGGYAIYQMKAQQLEITNWRVLLALFGAAYFVVRAGSMGLAQWLNRDEDEDEDEDTKKDDA